MILIIKHIDIEGPGIIGEFLLNTGFDLQVINLPQRQAKLPDSLKGIEAIICLGGPMNVYEEDKYPFLKAEDIFIKKALKADIPFLGLCLGAQLLAKACGAKVKKSPVKEVGWYKVDLTSAGKADRLFKGFPPRLNAFQWHEDTFEIPKGGVLLGKSTHSAHLVLKPGVCSGLILSGAACSSALKDGWAPSNVSKTCVNQAFRVGKNAYGLQFHLEVTPEMIESWINAYAKDSSAFKARLCKKSTEKYPHLLSRNFLEILAKSRK